MIDRHMSFDEYMTDPKIKELRENFTNNLGKDKVSADYDYCNDQSHQTY